jgi:predicted  nucleic acid-binding Zn-ribbon protein
LASAAELYELQKTDTMWEQVRRRLIAIRKQLGESEEVAAARAQMTATEKALHEWHGRQTDAELESRTLKERIADTEKRLMSGAVTNPKELESLQASLDALQRQRAGVEDKGVEAMLQVEELTKSLAAAQAAYERLNSQWRESQSELVAAEDKMKRNFVILKRRREAASTAMDEASLTEYEYLRKRKGGVAVAKVEDGNCGACHVSLPTGTLSALHGEARVHCPSCGRILYRP